MSNPYATEVVAAVLEKALSPDLPEVGPAGLLGYEARALAFEVRRLQGVIDGLAARLSEPPA